MKDSTENKLDSNDYSSCTVVELQAILSEKDAALNEFATLSTTQSDQIDSLTAKLKWFDEQLKLLKHQRFSKSSEKGVILQLCLFDENEEEVQAEPANEKTEEVTYVRKKPNRNNKNLDTSALPREKHYIDLPDSEKQCSCGNDMAPFGEESKEELVYIPPTLKVIEHIRLKYTCRKCDTVTMPPAVELPLSKSKAGTRLLTEIILYKYRYHLPLYRQSKMLANLNLTIPANTMGGWVMKVAECLEPLNEAMWQQLNTVHVLQADETPVKVLDPNKKAYLWLYHCFLPKKRFVLFDFSLSRSASVVNNRLEQYQGILQTDGYSGYNSQRKRDDIISLGCWDHARRKFTDVVKASSSNKHAKPGKAGMMLEKIGKLYEIERKIKTLPFPERKAIRQKEAKPKIDSIYQLLQKINAPPKSLLGIAVTYCKNQWGDLTRYVDHGEAEISNCLIENQVRPFAIGRKNWLFIGNEKAGQRAALLYSLIQSCELNNIDPRKYLEYVINKIHKLRQKEIDPATLLPNTIDIALLEENASSKV